jgi:hypothetical protein
MSRLPRLLQPYFSRDLHVGVLEIDSELSIYATVGEGGLDADRVAAMMADVSSCMAAFATVGDRKVSDLLK